MAVQEKLIELARMQSEIRNQTLVELRQGNLPNPRDRIEKIKSSWPNTTVARSVGGNSNIFFKERGRLKEKHTPGVTAHHLRFTTGELYGVAIYPYGIDGRTDSSAPIFQNPDTATMVSVALEYRPKGFGLHWLQYPVEPLFNIDEDGTVLARICDQPTPPELQLLNDILEQFEAEAGITY